MEHSKNYEKVLFYYVNKFWNIRRVWNAVGRWITAEEYKEITGTDYPDVIPDFVPKEK